MTITVQDTLNFVYYTNFIFAAYSLYKICKLLCSIVKNSTRVTAKVIGGLMWVKGKLIGTSPRRPAPSKVTVLHPFPKSVIKNYTGPGPAVMELSEVKVHDRDHRTVPV